MRKIVVNARFGGFSLSHEAEKFIVFYERSRELGSTPASVYLYENRDDEALVKCVETLGDKASGNSARLRIVEIPDDVEWKIEEYDGYEHVAEVHRTWHAQ
mgnify:CR=1 FL=1